MEASSQPRRLDFSRLAVSELVCIGSGLLLVVSLFLPWYSTDTSNANSKIDGMTGQLSAFDVHPILFWLLVLAATAPIVLAWIVVRGHELSWGRGEVTAIVAITVLVLLGVNAFITRPGSPLDTIELDYGWFVAAIAGLGMLVGALIRTAEGGGRKRPPGTF